jgi:hypothetical protein
MDLMAFTREFNVINQRSYQIWIFANLKDFFFHTVGWAQAVICAVAVIGVVKKIFRGKFKKQVLKPGPLFTLSLLASLMINNFLGMICGETIRIWIFFAAFFQIAVGWFCIENFPKSTLYLLIGSTCLQTMLVYDLVRFVWP